MRTYGSGDIAALHCVSSYPAETKDMNLSFIQELKKLGVEVGLSDHSLDEFNNFYETIVMKKI